MKKSTKLLALLLTVALMIGTCAVSAFAASGYAGQTTSVTISFPNVAGADGTITYSNPSMFSEIVASSSQGTVSRDKFYVYGAQVGTYSFKLTLKIADTAKVGDSCTITASYKTYDINGDMVEQSTTQQVVTVINKPVVVTSNLTELNKQIAIAMSLDRKGYTNASWEKLESALATAKSMTTSSPQATVDAAAKNLANAISALVKIDYQKLKQAISQAALITDNSKLNSSIVNFTKALEAANKALNSGNQSEVDNAANALLSAIEELKGAIQGFGTGHDIIETETTIIEVPGETVTVEVPVPGETVTIEVTVPGETVMVEVPVQDGGAVWMALAIIFIVITVACVAYIVYTVVKKKQSRKDNTPLVDYNIEDDDV